MIPPSAAINAIFESPRDPTAIIFLIEDTSHMVPLWSRLRDSYLQSLLVAIEDANPSISVSPFAPALPLLLIVTLQPKALWMSASERAVWPPFNTPSPRTPRWDDIPTINFGPHGGGSIISLASVTRAIEVRRVRFRRLQSDT